MQLQLILLIFIVTYAVCMQTRQKLSTEEQGWLFVTAMQPTHAWQDDRNFAISLVPCTAAAADAAITPRH